MWPSAISRALCAAGIADAQLFIAALPTVSREPNSSVVSICASKAMTLSMHCFRQSRVVIIAHVGEYRPPQLASVILPLPSQSLHLTG